MKIPAAKDICGVGCREKPPPTSLRDEMKKPIRNLFLSLVLMAAPVFAQTIVETSHRTPEVIKIAPGEVVPLIVTGLQTILPNWKARATDLPLPLTLGGMSVTLTQPPNSYSAQLPVLAIDQFNHCSFLLNPPPSCMVTAITVQIPFDIVVPNPLQLPQVADLPGTVLTVSENGKVSTAFVATPYPDRVHILQSCDIAGQTVGTGVCYPIVTHADGTLVMQNASGPGGALTHTAARPGEILVMYAWGLGPVSPAVQAGSPSPVPASTVAAPVNLRFEYGPNASPSMPIAGAQPIFAGLTPSEVGLYQINFAVPAPPAGTPNCGAPVSSNLTVSVSASGQSFSGAAICVDTN